MCTVLCMHVEPNEIIIKHAVNILGPRSRLGLRKRFHSIFVS